MDAKMGLTLDNQRYMALLSERPPRRVSTQDEYDGWADWLESLSFKADPTPEEDALADMVTVLLEDFDRREFPEFFEHNPLRALRYLMEQNEMSQADLARLLNISRTTASHIYRGERGISKTVAVKLAQHFHLPVGAFLPKAK